MIICCRLHHIRLSSMCVLQVRARDLRPAARPSFRDELWFETNLKQSDWKLSRRGCFSRQKSMMVPSFGLHANNKRRMLQEGNHSLLITLCLYSEMLRPFRRSCLLSLIWCVVVLGGGSWHSSGLSSDRYVL